MRRAAENSAAYPRASFNLQLPFVSVQIELTQSSEGAGRTMEFSHLVSSGLVVQPLCVDASLHSKIPTSRAKLHDWVHGGGSTCAQRCFRRDEVAKAV